jgi:hypothetical protein
MRPRREDRDGVASETLTLRLSPEDARGLAALVEARAAEAEALGGMVSKASVVRALIRSAVAAAEGGAHGDHK